MNEAKLVLFDIDGTLIKGGYPPSRKRYPHAFKKLFGKDIDINFDFYDGATDMVIVKYLLEKIGVKKNQINKCLALVFEESYHYLAKNIKSDYQKRLIKPAISLVKKLYPKKNIYLALLTGNQESVARLKINTCNLADYFRFGLFGHEAENRDKLAKLVFKRAKKFLGLDFKSQNIYIIGDTNYDIRCGKAIKAKTIAVATGARTYAQLKKEKPDLAVKTLANKKVINFIIKTQK